MNFQFKSFFGTSRDMHVETVFAELPLKSRIASREKSPRKLGEHRVKIWTRSVVTWWLLYCHVLPDGPWTSPDGRCIRKVPGLCLPKISRYPWTILIHSDVPLLLVFNFFESSNSVCDLCLRIMNSKQESDIFLKDHCFIFDCFSKLGDPQLQVASTFCFHWSNTFVSIPLPWLWGLAKWDLTQVWASFRSDPKFHWDLSFYQFSYLSKAQKLPLHSVDFTVSSESSWLISRLCSFLLEAFCMDHGRKWMDIE